MIRYIDLGEQINDYSEGHHDFAWYDTIIDCFIEYNGTHVWSSWEEFVRDFDDFEGEGYELERFAGLYPREAPWVAYGNDELKKRLGKNDKILCDKCGEEHDIILGFDRDTGKETDMVMGYKCGGVSYLCGVGGKIIPGVIKA